MGNPGPAGRGACVQRGNVMQKMSARAVVLVAGLAAGVSASEAGAQISAFWSNPVSGNWNNGALWSTNPDFPNNGVNTYDAFINAMGSAYTVTLNQNITVRDFTLDSPDATLDFSGGFTFTVTRDFLLRAGATLNGQSFAGQSITVGGNATFEDGVVRNLALFTGNGPVFYAANTLCEIDDTDINHGDGSALWASPGGIQLSNGATITNEAACVFTISTNAGQLTQGAGATGSFTNAGTLIRDTGTGIVDLQGVTFANTGTLDVRTGTFRTDGLALVGNTLAAGTWIVGGGSIDLVGQSVQTNQADVRFTSASGSFAAFGDVTLNDAGGSITVDGGRTFTTTAAADFQNTGVIDVKVGATFEVPAGRALLNASAGTIAGGEFLVAGTLKAPNLSGLTTIDTSLTLDGPGASVVDGANANALTGVATIGTNGSFKVRNGANFTTASDVTLNGQGTIGVGAGTTFTVNGTITNLATGTFTDGGLDVEGTLVFNDADIDTVAGNLSLNNATASIEDQFGNDAFRNLATVTAAGSLGVTNGRNLSVSGSLDTAGNVTIGTLGNGSTLTLPGAYNQTAGTTTLRDGTIDAAGGFNLLGGELRGSGQINGDVVTDGTIKPGNSPGVLRIDGALSIRTSAALEFELGGLTQGTGYDFLNLLSGNMTFLPGSDATMRLVLLPGFYPGLGERFTVVQTDTGRVMGAFEHYEGLELPNGYRFGVEYVRLVENDPSSVWRIDVIVTATPAPGAAMLFGLGGLLAARRRR
ncbi:MAG: hypothetical protein HBSAPP03_00250 [Phycisphaerae bacterium]|nr:MAG: hypothetical protein HBSAPP03_00250 [Phycisphaerae bacterium]